MVKKTGLDEYIKSNYEKLIKECADKFDMDNPYDIQEGSFDFFRNMILMKKLFKRLTGLKMSKKIIKQQLGPD